MKMKKLLLIAALAASLIANVTFAAKVQDWGDLSNIHKHVLEAINEMERARAANHYDMDGHGEKAEDLLNQAEHELHEAVVSAMKASEPVKKH